jgi:hypothetical protein
MDIVCNKTPMRCDLLACLHVKNSFCFKSHTCSFWQHITHCSTLFKRLVHFLIVMCYLWYPDYYTWWWKKVINIPSNMMKEGLVSLQIWQTYLVLPWFFLNLFFYCYIKNKFSGPYKPFNSVLYTYKKVLFFQILVQKDKMTIIFCRGLIGVKQNTMHSAQWFVNFSAFCNIHNFCLAFLWTLADC